MDAMLESERRMADSESAAMITAQEHGLMMAAAAVRQILPPQLEAVIIVYRPKDPTGISSIMATADTPRSGADQLNAVERGRVAARAFCEQKPNNPKFNPQS